MSGDLPSPVLTCPPGCQLPASTSLSALYDVSSQGGLGTLNFIQPLLKMEVLFQMVSYTGIGVSLMLRSIPGHLRKTDTIEAHTRVPGSWFGAKLTVGKYTKRF